MRTAPVPVAPALVRAAAVALAMAATEPAAAADDTLFAGRLNESNLDMRPGGPDAIGGLGDWVLSNETLCAVVADTDHETDLSPDGGALVDLGHCGRGDDQFVLLQPVLNNTPSGVIPVEGVQARHDAHEASLRVVGQRDGLHLETLYSVDRVTRERLRIVQRLERRAQGPELRGVSQIAAHAERALQAFAINTLRPASSSGFDHPAADLADRRSAIRAVSSADLHVLVGSAGIDPGIAYGIHLVSARLERRGGEIGELPRMSLVAESFSSLGSFVRPFWIRTREDGLGLLEALQTVFMDLAVGDTLVHELEVWVGERSDVASITDRIFSNGVPVRGRVDDPDARLHVRRAGGGAFTFIQPSRDGRFAFHLPSGRYLLRVRAPAGRTLERELRAGQEPVELGTLALAEPGRLALPRGAPMRLVILPEPGTPEVWFRDSLTDYRVGDEILRSASASNDLHLTGSRWDPDEVAIAPGTYRVIASRGPEYSASEARVSIRPGETSSLDLAAPKRAVLSPGWIGADLHVHAAPSDDSGVPLSLRLASYVAQGAEILVATDHDHVTDYRPWVEDLGLTEHIASVSGVELTMNFLSESTPHSAGHLNAFPISYQPRAYRKGVPAHEGQRLREILATLRALPGERVVQLNHPRGATDQLRTSEFFTHLGVVGRPFEPGLPLSVEPNRVLVSRDPASGLRDLDFDALEVMNGPDMNRYRKVREDWFALLRQGEVRTATANSDSHHLRQVAALPRNYVRVEADKVRSFDEAEFVRALRRGRSYGSTGPLLEMRLGQAGIGERFQGNRGTLRVEVRAAPWMPVDALRVFVNGHLVETQPVSAGRVVEIPLHFEADAFVTAEVEGSARGIYAELYPGFTPFAFTNPIFVDADGDGHWAAPGLP